MTSSCGSNVRDVTVETPERRFLQNNGMFVEDSAFCESAQIRTGDLYDVNVAL